jgi:two-component system, NtrC family, response regulator PilR
MSEPSPPRKHAGGRILVADDERSMREFLAICLRREGHEVSVAGSGQEALQALESAPADVLVTDLKMPGELGGLDLLRAVTARELETEVIVVTAYATPETAIEAMKQGAYDYLTKPFKVDEINAVISRALEKRALVAENTALREQVSGRHRLASLIGKSAAMQRVYHLIERVSPTRTNVLITGESGTGKELVARALHTEGNRAGAPFVAVNCGAIPDELMESELFGHVKGAFTGAATDKPGLFQEAHGGTLFLDEIGELSLSLQVKLLRALQERRIKRVGDTREAEVDVRVVAATNRDLEDEIQRGAFREDLYYRLNVIEIRIPPLRQRREDLPLLIDHFLRRFGNEQGRHYSGLSRDALRRLQDHDFPGNVRELENILEHAATLAIGEELALDDLPPLRQSAKPATPETGQVDIPDEGIALDRVLYDYERRIIERALDKAGGVRTRAAQLLGISFRSLRYRLAKLGLDDS